MADRILVTDDEKNVLRATVRRLQSRGYDVAGAGSGQEALDRLEEEPFDLLLVDIKMPDISGLELLRRARDTNPDILALIITGYGSVENAIEAMELGALGLVRKPVQIEELTAAIDNALARGRLRRENTRLRALLPLFELSRVLLSETDEAALIRLLAEAIVGEMHLTSAELLLWDDSGRLVRRAAQGLPGDLRIGEVVRDEIAAEAALRLEPVAVPDVDLAPPASDAGSRLYVPLVARNEAIGVVRVARAPGERSFRESDVEFLCTLCGQGAVALANARLFESLQAKQAEVEALLEEVIGTAERERLGLAMELHDGPVQSIVASQYEVEAGGLLIGHGMAEEAAAKLQEVRGMLSACLRSIRSILRDLSPPSPVEMGLVAAVREFVLNLGKNDGIIGCLEITGETTSLPEKIEREIYAIVREALSNVRKHTKGAAVQVLMHFAPDVLTVTVADDGAGFHAPDTQTEPAGHMGIRSMRERARLLGGNLEIETAAAKGTVVRLSVPVRVAAGVGPAPTDPDAAMGRAAGAVQDADRQQ